MAQPLLDMRHVEISYNGKPVVHDISLQMEAGEILVIVGESGSGKSVTQYSGVQLIASPPGRITEGEIMFEGQNLLSYWPNSE